MIDKQLYHTPNAVMRTLASPTFGATDLAVWTVEMAAGASGPMHTTDADQVWVVLEGRLALNGVEHDDSFVVAAGEQRRITAPVDARALVASRGGTTVTTAEGGTRPLPWAA